MGRDVFGNLRLHTESSSSFQKMKQSLDLNINSRVRQSLVISGRPRLQTPSQPVTCFTSSPPTQTGRATALSQPCLWTHNFCFSFLWNGCKIEFLPFITSSLWKCMSLKLSLLIESWPTSWEQTWGGILTEGSLWFQWKFPPQVPWPVGKPVRTRRRLTRRCFTGRAKRRTVESRLHFLLPLGG